MKNNFLLTLLAATVLAVAQPAAAAIVIVSGSGPTPLANSITLSIDGVARVGYGIDVGRPLIFGSYQAEFDSVANYANGQRAAWIYENYGSLVGGGLAVQLALWDVLNDGANGLSDGLVKLSPFAPDAIRSLGESIIAASLGQSSDNAIILLLSTPGMIWQPLITAPLPLLLASSLDAAEVPEPGTWMMVAAGLCLSRCYTRRK